MPPSPWLSARMMKIRYLTVTTIMSDQKISDSDAEHVVARVGVAAVRGRRGTP